MKLVITEKNDAAQKIASLLGVRKPTADKVYNTPVYRFEVDGEEWVSIGLRGHIAEIEFASTLGYDEAQGWFGTTRDGEKVAATVPDSLAKPPFKKRRGFTESSVELNQWRIDALPYVVYGPLEKIPKEKDIIRSLKNLAKKADSVVIGTDFDREGELIGSDALHYVREANEAVPVSRARYSAFTKEEITHAFSHLTELDFDLASAGESRREIDLVWGAVMTRFLSTVKRAVSGTPRSAGRVQTPTLALVVAREKERLAFVPEDYWVIKGSFCEGADAFEAPHATARFKTAQEAQKVMERIDGARCAVVGAIEKKKRTQAPPAPFNTTSLMAAAASEGLSPSRTMRIAESLYMRGLISYPRVDNTVYPPSLNLGDVVRKLSANPAYAPTCTQLLGKGELKATRGKQESTDHPPIYPTACATPDTLSGADWKLYNLVARRFLATLSDAAVIEGTKMTLLVNDEPFVAKGDVYVKLGFRDVYPYGQRKDIVLPQLIEHSEIPFRGAECQQKQTEPPARYSQGKLVQEMEKLGLGTKSTRASTIDRLYEVTYIQNDPIEPTCKGMAVIAALDEFAPEITHPEMTAHLEEQMTEITEGKLSLDAVVGESRNRLAAQLDALIPHTDEVREALAGADAADAYVGVCPKCGRDLQLRTSRKNRSTFIGCAGWPECDQTYSVPDGAIEVLEETCAVCGLPRIKVKPWRSTAQTICIDPACATNQKPKVLLGACPTCSARGLEHSVYALHNPKTLKRYARCENYAECNTSYPLFQRGDLHATDEACEHCGAPIVEIVNKRGPWRNCPNPECPGKAKPAEEAEHANEADEVQGKGGPNAKNAKNAKKTTKAKESTRTKKTTAQRTAAKK